MGRLVLLVEHANDDAEEHEMIGMAAVYLRAVAAVRRHSGRPLAGHQRLISCSLNPKPFLRCDGRGGVSAGDGRVMVRTGSATAKLPPVRQAEDACAASATGPWVRRVVTNRCEDGSIARVAASPATKGQSRTPACRSRANSVTASHRSRLASPAACPDLHHREKRRAVVWTFLPGWAAAPPVHEFRP